MGGGGIMIWAAICYHDRTDTEFIPTRMDSRKCTDIMDTHLSKHAHAIVNQKYIFQWDNTAMHFAKIIRAYVNNKKIDILPWPVRSPDLNIIERGILSREVYSR